MKGAMALPLFKTMSSPKNKRIRMIGKSQNFFLTLRNPHKSIKKSIFPPISGQGAAVAVV